MTHCNIIVTLILCLLSYMTISAQSITGKWKTIDDVSGDAKSILLIEELDGKYTAKVTDLLDPEYQGKNPLCEACPGDKQNQPIKGLEIMWDIKPTGNRKWGKGKIMDPENGKTYGCKLALESNDKLKVRGYLGFAAFGRNQFWYRMSDAE